ncbi:MAG: imidazolonepropionase, partial [Anaerolineae bacterium]|nr:imidazolonepropionase [Anaerolineae bacterium]
MTTVLGKTLYTGESVANLAYLNVEGSTIHSIGKQKVGDIAGEYDVITPALIDPHCHLGLIRGGEPGAEAEANEHMNAMLAHADVLDSIQMDDAGFADSMEAGVLYSCVLPGSGNIISGQSAIIRNYGTNTNDAFIRRAGIKGAIGYNPMSTRQWKGDRPYTRMGSMSILR